MCSPRLQLDMYDNVIDRERSYTLRPRDESCVRAGVIMHSLARN